MLVEPQELCSLGDVCLTESKSINNGWSSAVGSMQVASGAAGNSAQGPVFTEAHVAVLDSADIAVGRLAAVLEADFDDLYAVAFDISSQDEESARLSRATKGEVTTNPLLQTILGLK
ncbi:MAG: hypothetical protein ABIR39_15280 [Nocardioides sp.]|uniref:hypothetical protein n=1 Tax=Nocardioides sp. TaxID=35761 RepID=UPI0032677564